MGNPTQALRDFQPTQKFFIGIDSDGCVFDSMEIKHKECFAPMFIKHFSLQPVSKYAREVWEFVNLYSRTRGCNRFHAVLRALNLLRRRREVQTRGVEVPSFPALEEWVRRESQLGNVTLDAEVTGGNDALGAIQTWSHAVNAAVADIVQGVPAFPLVPESLAKGNVTADCMVISQTPLEALEREWTETGLRDLVAMVAGQEMGTKTQHLEFAANGKYAPEKIMMIGDAPGDQEAARSNDALFFPIIPGREEASWARLHDEGLERFFGGTFAGDYQRELVCEFDACLPESPTC